MKELNLRPETVKVPEESIWKKPFDICLSKDFLYDPKSTDNKSKNRQMGFHQSKKLITYYRRNNEHSEEKNPWNGRKHL
jgi:hypothetical protein